MRPSTLVPSSPGCALHNRYRLKNLRLEMERIVMALEPVAPWQGEQHVQHGCSVQVVEVQAESVDASLESSIIRLGMRHDRTTF